jgi:hypothetical protein
MRVDGAEFAVSPGCREARKSPPAATETRSVCQVLTVSTTFQTPGSVWHAVP